MASSDAALIAIKNQAYRITLPIFDGDGDLVSGAAGLDSEVSKDAGAFADCTNEATEIAAASGIYYLDLTDSEMNADTVAVIIKTTTSGAKTTPIVIYTSSASVEDVHSDTTIIASDLVLVYSDTTAIHSDTTIIASDVVLIYSDTTAIHSDTTIIASDVVLIYSDTTAIETDTGNIYSDTTIIASDVVLVYSDTTAIHSDTTIIASDVVLIYSDTTYIEANLPTVDAIWDEVMDANAPAAANTAREYMNIAASAHAGKDAGTGDWSARDLGDTKTRLQGTLSASGARSSVDVVDGT